MFGNFSQCKNSNFKVYVAETDVELSSRHLYKEAQLALVWGPYVNRIPNSKTLDIMPTGLDITVY